MDAFERYIYRVGRNGADPNASTMNSTKKSLNKLFHTSPSYSQVLLNNILTDAIVYHEENYNEKTILFRPDTNVNIGSVVGFDGSTYLVTEFFDRELDPKAKIWLCNFSISLLTQEVCNVVGQNDFGEDIIVCNPSNIIYLPCIVERSTVTSNSESAINLPEGKANVTIPFTINDNIKIGESIELYTEKYEIQDIDYTKSLGEHGLMILNVEKKVGES